MAAVIQILRRDLRRWVVVLDTPPLLQADDTIALLPQIDGVLLVLAVGRSTLADFEACKAHLETSHIVRTVLNQDRLIS
jgi:Mrp family chromosome partitioning ATPase